MKKNTPATSRPPQRWTPALRFVLAIAQIISVIGVSTINLTQPKFAPLVGDALGPWARTAAEAVDAFIGAPNQAAAAVACTFDAPVVNPSFTGSAAGWSLGGSWIYNNGTVVNSGDTANDGTLSQNVTQVAPSSRVRFTIAWGNSGAANQVALLTISYGGVTYATMLTGGTGGGSFAAQNGATIASSTGTFPFNTNVNMTLVLPAGIPATGALSFAMSRSGATVGVLDDYFIGSIDVDTTRLCVRKQTVNGTGTFNFASSNLDNNQVTAGTQSTAAITTLSSGVFEAADANTGVAGSQGGFVLNEAANVVVTETLVPNWAVSGTCYDATTSAVVANIAASGVVTLPAASVVIGGSYICDYTNTYPPAVLTATKTAFPSLVQPGDLVSFTAPNGYTFTVPNATVDTADSDVTTPQGGTPSVTLTPNEFNSTIDAGLWRPMSLGNRVWEDTNNDGLRGASEPGVANVSVALLSTSGAVLSTTTTNVSGYYTFTNLISGTYVVSITAPTGYRSSDDIGSSGTPDNNIDSDDNGVGAGAGQVASNPITLAPGTEPTADDVSEGLTGDTRTNWTMDFGIWRPAALGDFVWSDLDADGQQDGSEPGVSGVVVTLTRNGIPISATTTNAAGAYTFTNLISGTYSVTFGLPAGFTSFTTPNSGSDVTDSDANVVTGVTGNYVLFPGDVEPTVDAGLIQPAGLGDRVWQDFNHNGIQDAGEPGVPNVTVTLRTPTGTLTTLTNPNGVYTFTNLTPGVPYTVSFTAPNGYTFTVPNATTDTADSDVTTPQGGTPSVTLASNEFNSTIDAGLWQPMRLGNQVWLDTNNNGVIDAGEVGIDNVTVSLYADTNNNGVRDGGDALIGAALTSGGGYYLFTDLISNTYFVTLLGSNFQPGAALANYQNSSLTVGGNSDLNEADHGTVAGVLGQGGVVNSGPITLIPGTEPLNDGAPINDVVPNSNSNYSIDFGFYKLEVGNQVWEDTNNNGLKDVGEPGLAGVPVALLNAGGTVLSATATHANGFYTFTNLISGTYVISITPPAGMLSSAGQDVGDSIDNNDNGALNASGVFIVSQPFALTPGNEPIVNNATGATQNPTIDFGLWRPAALGDLVWLDVDADGQQDAGEPGVSGVAVTLTRNGTPISTTMTNGVGYYTFTNLISGTYSVTFGLPAGFGGFTTPNTGSDATDSDAVPTSPTLATTGNYAVFPGDQQPTVDAGLVRTASLGDLVWEDYNHDGVQSVGEPGVANVTVTLQTPTTTLVTTTDANGLYTFTNLTPGVPYVVSFTAPNGYAFTVPTVGNASTDSNANPNTGSAPSVTLSPNEFNPTIDAGLWRPASLGNTVWVDLNHNGLQDVGEPGLSGVIVTLQTPTGTLSMATNASGLYSFTNLLPGVPYTVSFAAPSGYAFTVLGSNPASDTDSNANPLTGAAAPVTLTPGEFNPTIDAGVWQPASLGNFVWDDRNHDGVQSVGELGISGVTVTLQTPTGPLVTTTDASGFYSFTNLLPGVSYTVSFALPAGYSFTVQGNNASSDTDSNANPVTGAAAPVVLAPGEFNPTIDAGVWQAVGLGDLVWYDTDHDGVQDGGEPGVPNMTVTLQTVTGTLMTGTDANGFYSFTNLVPGVPYTAGFTAPEGYTFTLPAVGDTAHDSNVNPTTGEVLPITLAPGQFDDTIDAGLWLPLPNLTLVKTAHLARGTVRSGELITYTLVVRNDGPGIATSVVVSDPLASTLEYVTGSAVPAAQVTGQTLVWTKLSLGAGEEYTITLVARVLPSNLVTNTQITNIGYVFAIGPDNKLVNLPNARLEDAGQSSVPIEPTAVVLTLFRSTWLEDGSGVHVAWETGSEINTLGFGLYRSADGTRASAVLVTPELIASRSNNNGGASYSFDDVTAQAGTTYTYWLQEQETTGALNEYGPVDTNGRQIVQPRVVHLYLPALMR